MLVKQDILINLKKQSWRFKIASNKLEIINFKEFVKKLVKHNIVYTIIYANITKTLVKRLIVVKVSNKLRDF